MLKKFIVPGLAPSKLKILMVAYVHIQYSTYQFSGESKNLD